MSVVRMQQRTYVAQPFKAAGFQIAGTLDGYVDFATPARGTYQLSIDECVALIAGLHGAINDIRANCLYDRDALLEKS